MITKTNKISWIPARKDVLPLLISKYPYIMIFVVALISLTWFRDHSLITSFLADYLPVVNHFDILKYLYIWCDGSLGYSAFTMPAIIFPVGFLSYVFKLSGLENNSIQLMYFYFMFTMMGVSMCFLLSSICSGKYKKIIMVIGGILFMFNIWNATFHGFIWSALVFLPLILGMYIRGLKDEKKLYYAVLTAIVWLVTCSNGMVNMRFTIFFLIFMVSYLIFYILINNNRKKGNKAIKYTGFLLVCWILINSYWSVSVIWNSLEIVNQAEKIYKRINFEWTQSFLNSGGSFWEILRLTSYWAFKSTFNGENYFAWSKYYFKPFMIVIGYLLPVISFSYYYFKKNVIKCNEVIYFTFIALIGILVMAGGTIFINKLIVGGFKHYATIFKEPYLYGGYFLVFAYSILFPIGVVTLYENYKNKYLRILLSIIVFLIIGIYSFPMWTGQLFRDGNKVFGSERYSIPDYWQEAINWANKQEDYFRILPQPFSEVGYMSYKWGEKYYTSIDPVVGLFEKPVLCGTGYELKIAERCKVLEPLEVCRQLGMMGIKYIMIIGDANPNFIKNHPYFVETVFNNNLFKEYGGILEKEKEFGFVKFYRIPDEYIKPIIFIDSDKANARKVQYKKIDPTKYELEMETNVPTRIVFNNRYDKGWVLLNKNNIKKKYNNIMANSFANSFEVDDIGKNKFVIEFVPQRLVYIGTAISIVSFIIFCSFAIITRRKEKCNR